MDRKQRFALFVAALEEAPAASDRASARELVTRILNAIEDAHSGALYDPPNWMTDGRMYPPHDDFEQPSPVAHAALFHTVGHRVWIADNGAIQIEVRKGQHSCRVELDKAGADGAFFRLDQ